MLEALLRAAPAFLSAENLLEQVWDEHADPFTNTVFITISRLRRKLGEPPVIETRPGVGYRSPRSARPDRDWPWNPCPVPATSVAYHRARQLAWGDWDVSMPVALR